LGVCGFGEVEFGDQLDGGLQLMPAVPEYIWGHPNNPERDSDNKDH
jgi:hypothetical protein